jgi:hypothetical protein
MIYQAVSKYKLLIVATAVAVPARKKHPRQNLFLTRLRSKFYRNLNKFYLSQA